MQPIHFHKGAMSISLLSPGAAFAAFVAFAFLAPRRSSGDDAKLSSPFAILCCLPAGLRGRPGFGFIAAAVAVVAVRRRKRGLALDATQHDQVDEAAIPALVSKVAARNEGVAHIKNTPLQNAVR